MASNKKSARFKIGDYIYLQAHAKGNKNLFLLCHGYITRLPTEESPIYKVIATEVCRTSTGKKDQTELASQLVGMTLPCKEDQLSFNLTEFMKLAYSTTEWLKASSEELIRIKKILDIKKRG